jgi:hypothetical protein
LSLATIMLDQLTAARRIVEDGHEVVPAWRITTLEGAFLILTRFDSDKPGQRERATFLLTRFMTWKILQRIKRGEAVGFSYPMWLAPQPPDARAAKRQWPLGLHRPSAWPLHPYRPQPRPLARQLKARDLQTCSQRLP